MSYFKLFEDFTIKPIWTVEKMHGLESVATDKTDDKLVQKYDSMLDSHGNQTGNIVTTALSPFKPVKVIEVDGPYHPNRCFLSSLEFNKDNEKNESVVGILKRKGSNRAWVHAFNKLGDTYFDKSLKPEFNTYEHFVLGTCLAKDEEDLANVAWIHANSLQKSAKQFVNR